MQQDRYRHQTIGLLLATMLTLAGAQGSAAAAEVRTIQLQNGSIYSGELVEWIPGDHVTLRLITGEIRRVPWTELALQQPPPPEAPPAAAPPAAAPPVAAPPANAPYPVAPAPTAPPPYPFFQPPAAPGGAPVPGTLLTIRSNNPQAQLIEITGGGYVTGYGVGRYYGYGASLVTWRNLCTVPCNQVVPAGGSYRIAGPNVVPSRPFTLSPGSAELQVKAGKLGVRVGGLLLTGLGASTIIIGGVLLGVSKNFGSGSPFYDPAENTAFRAAGGVLLGVGIGSIITGIAMLATSGTKVQITNTSGGAPNGISWRPSSGHTLALSAQGLHF